MERSSGAESSPCGAGVVVGVIVVGLRGASLPLSPPEDKSKGAASALVGSRRSASSSAPEIAGNMGRNSAGAAVAAAVAAAAAAATAAEVGEEEGEWSEKGACPWAGPKNGGGKPAGPKRKRGLGSSSSSSSHHHHHHYQQQNSQRNKTIQRNIKKTNKGGTTR